MFEHYLVKPQSPLVRGFDDRFYAVHSRNTDVRREDVELAELQLEGRCLCPTRWACTSSSRPTAAASSIVPTPSTIPTRCALEYERDVKRGLNPQVPAHYFPNDDPTAEPLNVWRSQAQLFYTNWLNYYVYQTTPYDLARRLRGALGCRRGLRLCSRHDERGLSDTRAWIFGRLQIERG